MGSGYNNTGETWHRIGYRTMLQPTKPIMGRKSPWVLIGSWWDVNEDHDGNERGIQDPPKSKAMWVYAVEMEGEVVFPDRRLDTDTVANVVTFIEKSLGVVEWSGKKCRLVGRTAVVPSRLVVVGGVRLSRGRRRGGGGVRFRT